MRRFRTAHEALIPDDSVRALWRCDEASGNLTDSAYSAAYTLTEKNQVVAVDSLFNSLGTGTGARGRAAAATTGWWESATAASAHLYAATDWSLSFWTKHSNSSVTQAYLEYASQSAPTTASTMMAFGLYRLGNGNLRIASDLSTTSLNHFKDFNCAIGTDRTFVGLRKKQTPANNCLVYDLVLNDRYHSSVTMPILSVANEAYESGKWVLGASRRFGSTNGDTPAFAGAADQGLTIDDVAFYAHPVLPQKHVDTYRNGVRPWDERRLLDSNHIKGKARVWLEDGDGVMQDMTAFYGVDWVQEVSIKEDVDQPSKTANVRLQRISAGGGVDTRTAASSLHNLSPFTQESKFNTTLTIGTSQDKFIELRRKVRIEIAAVPQEWKLQGWEAAVAFEGFVDSFSVDENLVELKCTDNDAILADLFQIDPRSYDYYTSETLSETHIQALIANNAPVLTNATSAYQVSYNYLGGATPILYTPASTGWVLRYDDTPSGKVSELLRSVADQIGWDLRWRFYDPWHEHRLTYYDPPRNSTLEIANVSEVSGQVIIVFRTPHELQPEQSITIAGTTNFNGSQTVEAVLSAHSVRCVGGVSGTPSAETVGSVTYNQQYTLQPSQIKALDGVEKNVEDIRNVCIVKYGRTNETASLPVVEVTAEAGTTLFVQIDPADSQRESINYLEVGHSFTIEGCPNASANGDWTIGSAVHNGFYTAQVDASWSVSETSALFTSDYIPFKQATAVDEASITRYGFRSCAIYEEASGNIDTPAEAHRLANAVVSDLANPTADVSVTLNTLMPWVELHDRFVLNGDPKKRIDAFSGIKSAVVSYEHTLNSKGCYTRLALRNERPSRGTEWTERIRVTNVRPAIPIGHQVEVNPALVEPAFATREGGKIRGKIKDPRVNKSRGGRRRKRTESTEVHLSTTTAGFVPNKNTLVSGRNDTISIEAFADGTQLTPGTTYYVKYRFRDVFGNLSAISGATAVVARFTEQQPGALVHRSGGAAGGGNASVKFARSGAPVFYTFPFTNGTSSPGFILYDTYSLYSADFVGTAITVDLAGPSVGNNGYFRMPCDGIVDVVTRFGVRTDVAMASTTFKFGLFRVGRTLVGYSATAPVVPFYSGYWENESSDSAGAPHTFTLPQSNGATTGYVNLMGSVSAYSGDYIALGVSVVETLNGWTCACATTGSASISWARFTVRQK